VIARGLLLAESGTRDTRASTSSIQKSLSGDGCVGADWRAAAIKDAGLVSSCGDSVILRIASA
jgi:hypothetical protein